MERAQIARSVIAACAPAAAWVALLEAITLAFAHDLGASALAWLALATVVLSLAGNALLALVVVGIAPLVPGAAWLAERPQVRRVLGVAALIGSVALHAANAVLYVRLYAALHAALAAMVLATSFAGWALVRTSASASARGTQKLALGLAVFWLVGLASALASLLSDESLRASALEQSTQLAHELHALDSVSGVLAIDDTTPAPSQLDPEVWSALEPRALTAPSGVARNANVVLITIDSMRYDRWLAGGAARPLMPELERLAATSTRFSYAYAPSCWTIHSMGAVLFGTLPSLLPLAYMGVTAELEFIDNENGAEMVRDPLNFKKVTPVPVASRADTLIDALNAGGYETATVASYIYYFRGAGLTADFAHVDEEGYRSLGIGPSGLAHVPMVERTTAWLDRRDAQRPFFLWLHFMDAHAPYEARDKQAEGASATERYDSELRYVDGQLALLRAALEQRGLWGRTIAIVHADHGEEFGDHGGTFHATTLYDETARVPLLVRLPEQASGQTIDTPVSLLDLAPTVLDLIGVPNKATMMGRSLRAELQGQQSPARPILMECDRFAAQKRAYLRWPFKLIVDRANHTAQLYALPGDPGERVNLAGQQPQLLQGLTQELGGLMGALDAKRGATGGEGEKAGTAAQP